MINTLFLPELREMLAEGDMEGLREFCDALHPARAAEFMEGLTADESWQVLLATDQDHRTAIFGFLDHDRQVQIAEQGDRQLIAELLADMAADDRVDLLNEVQADSVQALMPLLPVEERREIQRLQSYPEGTAGSVMTTEVARLPESLTVREALDAISRQAEELETVYYNYIVDSENHLRGLISARQLVTHFRHPDTPISELMQRDVVAVKATDDQETVARKVANYNFLAIPVVDEDRHLLGIITHDDILDVMQAEATEDAHRSAAVAPLEDSYLDTPWMVLAWKRGIWLTILFVTGLATALLLRSYEHTLEQIVWLIFFIPLIMSSGGNTGNQSATLVITALTNGELTPSDGWKVMRRELVMGLSLGLFLGTLGYFCAFGLLFALRASPGDDATLENVVAKVVREAPSAVDLLVIPITLVGVILCGTLCGGALPLLFRRMGFDPALMSNPFVAGIIDICGIVIYMSVALVMLEQLSL